MEYLSPQLPHIQEKENYNPLDLIKSFSKNFFGFFRKVKHIGVTSVLPGDERAKLVIFNQLNFFQFITGLIVPLIGLFNADKFPAEGWIIISLPALTSISVLVLNAYHHY